MRKELGQWLLDVAKYVTTAFLLTNLFNLYRNTWIVYVFAITCIVVMLVVGLFLIKNNKK